MNRGHESAFDADAVMEDSHQRRQAVRRTRRRRDHAFGSEVAAAIVDPEYEVGNARDWVGDQHLLGAIAEVRLQPVALLDLAAAVDDKIHLQVAPRQRIPGFLL